MKICVSMWSLYHSYVDGKIGIVDFIHWVSALEAEGVELLDFFWQDVENELPAVLEALVETNLKVGAYAVGNNFAMPEAADRERQLKVVTDGVDLARKLNTNVVRIFSGDLSEGVTADKARDWILEGLQAATAYAEKHGVTLALENHGQLAGKSIQIQEFIAEINSPFLKSTFDTGNFLLVDEEPTVAAERLAVNVAHVHFKDFREHQEGDPYPAISLAGKKYTGTIPGEGLVDLNKILRTLKDANYNGWLSVEFEGTGDDKVGTTVSVNNLVKSLGEI